MTTAIPFLANISSSNNTSPNKTDISQFGHSLSSAFSMTMAVAFCIIIVTSVFANTILILIIVTSRKLYSITHVFIVNLAIGDMFTSLFVIPFDASFMLERTFTNGIIPCGIMQATFLMSLPLAVLNLCLLTIERFVTISFPFKRDRLFTNHKIILILLTAWLYTLLVSLFPFLYDENALSVNGGVCMLNFPLSYSIFHIVVNFFLPVLGILVLDFMIFRIAHQHEKRIQSTLKDAKKHQRKLVLFRKAAKRILLLVGVCTFCWLTFITLVIWNVTCGICHPREITWIGNAINYLSVSVNPILYGLLNVSIRKELLEKSRRIFLKSSRRDKDFIDINSKRLGGTEEIYSLTPRLNRNEFLSMSPMVPFRKKSDFCSMLRKEQDAI